MFLGAATIVRKMTMTVSYKRRLIALLLLVFAASACCQELQCSLSNEDFARRDPNLRAMTYDVGDGPQTTWVYIEPPVESFYPPGEAPSSTKVVPKFNGFAGKFINMSNQKVTLYWCVVLLAGSSLL